MEISIHLIIWLIGLIITYKLITKIKDIDKGE